MDVVAGHVIGRLVRCFRCQVAAGAGQGVQPDQHPLGIQHAVAAFGQRRRDGALGALDLGQVAGIAVHPMSQLGQRKSPADPQRPQLGTPIVLQALVRGQLLRPLSHCVPHEVDVATSRWSGASPESVGNPAASLSVSTDTDPAAKHPRPARADESDVSDVATAVGHVKTWNPRQCGDQYPRHEHPLESARPRCAAARCRCPVRLAAYSASKAAVNSYVEALAHSPMGYPT